MSDSNQNSEEESNPDDFPNPCECDTDKERVKNLTRTLNGTIIDILDSNPAFSSFLETQILSFRRELTFFIRRLFDAKRQNAIKVAQKD